MNKKYLLNTLTFVLLTLMFFKVSALHVYSHQESSADQIENCKICELAIENQEAEQLYTTTVYVDILKIVGVETTSRFENTQAFTSSNVHFRLFGRPPPALG